MSDQPSRSYSLASCYENALTTIVRLVSLPPAQLPSAETFRQSIAGALKVSREKGKSLGYGSEANNSAFFAVVAFLDESVLRLQNPAFDSWARRPLQEELFNHNRAGEIFFDNLRGLLGREDSPETADCLEVYCLCLLLGFKGRYALGGSDSGFFRQMSAGAASSASRPSGEIDTLVRQARQKIDRIRGQMHFPRAAGAPPEIQQVAAADPWSRGLGIAAIGLFVLALLFYGGFWALLSSGASQAL